MYLRCIDIYPKYYKTYYKLGKLYMYFKIDYKKSERMFLKSITINPKDFITYLTLGDLY